MKSHNRFIDLSINEVLIGIIIDLNMKPKLSQPIKRFSLTKIFKAIANDCQNLNYSLEEEEERLRKNIGSKPSVTNDQIEQLFF